MLDIYIAQTRGYESNCYMLVSGGEAAVVDPSVPLSAFNIPEGIKVTKILLTHGHFDHILELDSYLNDGVEVFISENDAFMLKDSMGNASSLFGLPPVRSVAKPITVRDGALIYLADQRIEVFSTPGHTEGSVCYITEDAMFSGDTLFSDGIGRCDLIGGDICKMRASLKRLAALDHNYKVYPGHGELTYLNKEKKYNYELSRFNAQNK